MKKKEQLTVYLVEYKGKAVSGSYEFDEMKLYFLNNRKKSVFEQMYHLDALMRNSKIRSIAALERKYYSDYERFKHLFKDFEFQVTKIGPL